MRCGKQSIDLGALISIVCTLFHTLHYRGLLYFITHGHTIECAVKKSTNIDSANKERIEKIENVFT